MDSRLLARLGWTLFALGWVPFAGIFVGLIGFPEGSYNWSDLPTLTRYSIIATGITFGLSMLILFASPLLGWWKNRRVLKKGQPADAEVLETWDTGTTINQNPVVGLRLKVFPGSGSPFVAETEQLISRLQIQRYQPGSRVKVRYDPETKEVALLEP